MHITCWYAKGWFTENLKMVIFNLKDQLSQIHWIYFNYNMPMGMSQAVIT